jgi:uncharacterized protein with HEPN domain
MYNNDDLLCFSILESVNRILEFAKEYKDVEEFKKDYKGYDATIMNFIVIGEMTGKLSEQFKDENPDIEWHKIYGFRNILAYDYFGINDLEIWKIIQIHTPELKSQMEKILN